MNQSQDPDWFWIQKIQEGERSAFNEIFSRHKVNVINLAYRFTRSRQTAEDIAQDIFIKIYEGKVRVDPKAKFTTWLYRVTANASIDFLRRRKFTAFSLDVKEEFRDPRTQLPDETVKEEEIKALVQREVDQLPEKLRSPIILYQFEEMPYREVAKILGISEKAVERRIYHAKEILRKKLGGLR